jgi:hypothetical protein
VPVVVDASARIVGMAPPGDPSPQIAAVSKRIPTIFAAVATTTLAIQENPWSFRGTAVAALTEAFNAHNVIVIIVGAKERFAQHCERLPIGMATLRLRSGMSLRVFTVREGEGS